VTSKIKPARDAKPQQKTNKDGPSSVSAHARRQAAAILEVLAGVCRPTEAAQVLDISLPRYYQLEQRALKGLLTACEPVGRGRRLDGSRRLTTLERENGRLRRECDRQQALVRMTERSLGLAPAASHAAAKGVDSQPGTNGAKRRRPRRATVRALKMAQTLRLETTATEGVAQETTTPVITGE
jgi:hypothetical protein